jgi:hypothetical protein
MKAGFKNERAWRALVELAPEKLVRARVVLAKSSGEKSMPGRIRACTIPKKLAQSGFTSPDARALPNRQVS